MSGARWLLPSLREAKSVPVTIPCRLGRRVSRGQVALAPRSSRRRRWRWSRRCPRRRPAVPASSRSPGRGRASRRARRTAPAPHRGAGPLNDSRLVSPLVKVALGRRVRRAIEVTRMLHQALDRGALGSVRERRVHHCRFSGHPWDRDDQEGSPLARRGHEQRRHRRRQRTVAHERLQIELRHRRPLCSVGSVTMATVARPATPGGRTMPQRYVASDSATGLEIQVTGEFPDDPDDRVRIARTSTLCSTLTQMGVSEGSAGGVRSAAAAATGGAGRPRPAARRRELSATAQAAASACSPRRAQTRSRRRAQVGAACGATCRCAL